MDDRLEEEHDFKKTLREAKDLDGDAHAFERARRLDSEMAYEALAVSSSMGMFGMEESVADLMSLELAQEMLYKQQAENDNK